MPMGGRMGRQVSEAHCNTECQTGRLMEGLRRADEMQDGVGVQQELGDSLDII